MLPKIIGELAVFCIQMFRSMTVWTYKFQVVSSVMFPVSVYVMQFKNSWIIQKLTSIAARRFSQQYCFGIPRRAEISRLFTSFLGKLLKPATLFAESGGFLVMSSWCKKLVANFAMALDEWRLLRFRTFPRAIFPVGIGCYMTKDISASIAYATNSWKMLTFRHYGVSGAS